jgi:hypothetical protein
MLDDLPRESRSQALATQTKSGRIPWLMRFRPSSPRSIMSPIALPRLAPLVQHASRSVNSCESSRSKAVDGLGIAVQGSNGKIEGKRIGIPGTGTNLPLFGSNESTRARRCSEAYQTLICRPVASASSREATYDRSTPNSCFSRVNSFCSFLILNRFRCGAATRATNAARRDHVREL